VRPQAGGAEALGPPGPVIAPAERAKGSSVSLALFALLHAVNDQYTAFLAAVMPLLLERFGFGLGVAGVLAAVQSTSTSFAQPVFGWLLDRAPRKPSILVWPVVTSVALSAFGLVPSWTWLVPLLVIGGLSTAAFHPHATSSVPAVARGRASLGMAVFVSGGTIGYAFGPVLILSVVGRFGLGASWLAALPTLLLCAYLMRNHIGRIQPPEGAGVVAGFSFAQFRALFALWLIVALRSTVGTAFMAFLGVHLRETGFPIMLVGWGLLVFTAAGAAGGMVGGHLSDRVGGKAVIAAGLLLMAPLFWMLLRVRGAGTWALLAGAGFSVATFNPVTVVMAQKILPGSKGTASGIIMGLGWSVGGLLVGAIGTLAESYGLVPVLSWLLVLLVPALAIAASLPGRFGVPEPVRPPAAVPGSR